MPREPLDTAGCQIASILEKVCMWNQEHAVAAPTDSVASWFESVAAPSISIADYMRQIQMKNCGHLWPQVFILVDQLSRALKIPVHNCNVHRLLCTGVLIALKLSVDAAGLSKLVRYHGGVSLHELNGMEGAFLKALDFRVTISPEVNDQLLCSLPLIEMALTKACSVQQDVTRGPIFAIPESVLPEGARFGFPAQDAADLRRKSERAERAAPVKHRRAESVSALSRIRSFASSSKRQSSSDATVHVPCPPSRPSDASAGGRPHPACSGQQ